MFTSRRITTMGGDKFRDEFSLTFDGTDDYINCGSDSSIDNIFDGGGTIAGWIKVASDGENTYGRIIDKSSGANGAGGWTLNVQDEGSGAIDLNFMAGHSSQYGRWATTAREITLNTWTHFAVVYDDDATSNNPVMYINGVSVAIGSPVNTPSGTKEDDSSLDLLIGQAGSGGRSYDGSISEIVMYDTELTASQVRTLYNGREPYNHKEGIASGNLKAWWRMGDGTLDKASLDRAGDDTGLICDEVNPKLGAELVSNGDFDDETNYSDYNMEGDDTADLSTEQVLVGSNSLKIDVDSSGEGTRLGGVATTTGKTYRISAWFYVTAGTAKINPGDGYWSPNALEPKTNVTNEWQQLVMYNTADQNSSNAWIYLVAGSSNSVFYLDNVSVREVQGNPGIFLNSDNQFTGDTP